MESVRVGPVVLAWADTETTDRALRRAAGDSLLARLIADLGLAAGRVGRRCPTCGGTDHGRPVADAPVALSLSYAGSMVAAAATRLVDAASVGIDIESTTRDSGDLRLLFAPRDPPDLAGWTRIEAVLKADGRGVRIDPSTVVIDGSRSTQPGGFEVATVAGPAGFVVSVAAAA